MPLATLNPSRLELLIQRYLAEVQQQAQQTQQAHQGGGGAEQPAAQGQQAGGGPRRQPWCMAYADASPQRQLYGYQQTAAMGERAQHVAVSLPTPADLAPQDPVFHVPWLKVGTPLTKLVRQHGNQLAAVVQQRQQLEERQRQQQQQGQQHDVQQQGQQQDGPAAEQQGGPQQQSQQQDGSGPQQLHLLVPDGAGGMHLLLHERAESADCILGFLHAYLVQECCSGGCGTGTSSGSSSSEGGSGGSSDASASEQRHQQQQQQQSKAGGPTSEQLAYSLAQAQQLLPGLLTALEAAGWDDQKVVLEPKRRRVVW